MSDTHSKHSIHDSIKAFIITTIIVSMLGYVDYITGEISIDVLYIICICFVTWYTYLVIGILCVFEILLAKIFVDYYDNIKIGAHLYEWNTFSYLLMYLIICILVGQLKKALSK